jgi:hypothetical protein
MFLPAADDDVPAIVTLMNRAYRGAGAAGWSTQESYLDGARITEEVLRANRSRHHSRHSIATAAGAMSPPLLGRTNRSSSAICARLNACRQRHGKTGSPIN